MNGAGRRRPRVRGLTILLIATMAAGLSIGPAQVRAGGGIVVTNLPPSLLNVQELIDSSGLYYATPAELTALSDLDEQAVANTIADHGLSSSDTNAVYGWARDDAEGELYALLVQAAGTPACASGQTPGDSCRTTDQQGAVQWLADMARREGALNAYDAGLEYVKWAGLSQATYNAYVAAYDADLAAGKDTSTDATNLQDFLQQGFTGPADYADPTAGTTWTSSTSLSTIQQTATEGYCAYRSPAPYQTDYQGNIFSGTDGSTDEICYTAGGIGSLITGLPADVPAYDDFVKWGEADANYSLINSFNYTETAHDIALGIGLGGVAASVVAGVTLGATLGPLMAGTAFAATVFPNAGFVSGASAAFFATTSAVGTSDAAVAAASAGAVSAAGVGAIVGAVLLFVTGTTLEAIQLAQASELPGQLATLIEQAPSHSYDPGSMINDSNGGAGELYSLFVNATMPSPQTDCSASAPQLPTDGVCLYPPAPPAPDLQHDPEFLVSENGGTATAQPSISWFDKVSKVTADAWVHETWFVEQLTDSQGNSPQVTYGNDVTGSESQALRIAYTDWSGTEQTAMLVDVPNSGYQFLSMAQQKSGSVLDPSTCTTTNPPTCAYSDTIDYIDSSGNKYAAKLVPPIFPTVTTPTWSPASPIEGQPVRFSTTVGTSVPNVSGSFTETWTIQDKPLNPPLVICYNSQLQQIQCPPPTVTLTGNPVTYSFPTSGAFTVTVTASDAVGRSASSTTTVNVGDVAPTLSPYGICAPGPFVICLPPYNVTPVAPGSTTTLGGDLLHAGSEDVESLDVNWGDGSQGDSVSNSGGCAQLSFGCDANLSFDYAQATTSSGSIDLPFSATHAYANPGTYTVTLTATDQSGAKSTKTVQEAALYPTQTTLSSSASTSVYGQSVTFTATVSSTAPIGPTGTVTFYDGATDLGTGTLSTTNDVTTATLTTSSLPLGGGQSISASYAGDGGNTFQGSYTLSPLSQTVNRAVTSTSIGSQPDPSVWGQSVTFTAIVSVTSPGAGNPDGTVDFKDGSVDISGCANALLNSTTETATCTTSALAVAGHSVTASFGGDVDFTGSTTGSAWEQTVNRAGSTTQVSTSSSIVTQGQPVTFTATVSAKSPGAGTPTGSATFYDGTTSLGTGTLSTTNDVTTATITTSSLAVGAHGVTASYGGDSNFNTSTGAAVTQYINTNLSSFPTLPGGAYDLSNANLSGDYFVGLNLSGASLTGSNLEQAVFLGADLNGANLSNSNFMSGADFTGANLATANLSNSNLDGANFAGANLATANLSNSNLKGAGFANADLTGANFTNANLKGATGLSTATLNGITWNATTCPDGTDSAKDGGTCVDNL